MHGLALAPVSGMAMAELLTEGRSSVDLSAFNPNRFRL
jgi:glycine/D-amino acid oxidase-like deaminating enzyme